MIEVEITVKKKQRISTTPTQLVKEYTKDCSIEKIDGKIYIVLYSEEGDMMVSLDYDKYFNGASVSEYSLVLAVRQYFEEKYNSYCFVHNGMEFFITEKSGYILKDGNEHFFHYSSEPTKEKGYWDCSITPGSVCYLDNDYDDDKFPPDTFIKVT